MQVQNKFSTYLTEAGFYFANIRNPKRTLWGQRKLAANGKDDAEVSTDEDDLENDRKKDFALYQKHHDVSQ